MIAFTICSNNYLSQAKVLGDSWLKFHPETKFKIILVDKFSDQIDYNNFSPFEIILAEDLGIEYFDELVERYHIVELNTAVKPHAFIYLFEKTGAKTLVYLDPDILITSRNVELLEMMDSFNYAVTPHMMEGIDDGYNLSDHGILRTGVFNLGFIAFSEYEVVRKFLFWWRDRLRTYGHTNYKRGQFHDQLWVNYLPCFCDNYHIIKHKGYNMANWNMHERTLSWSDVKQNYLVNKTEELRFFHFSNYSFKKPDVLSSYCTRYNFENRQDVKSLFHTYLTLLVNQNIELYSAIPCVYQLQHIALKEKSKKKKGFSAQIKSKILSILLRYLKEK